jgi:signal transduction histidine kinase
LTYDTGLPQFTPMMQQLKWGRLISAYMPILNSSGDVVGIIGVDFQGEDIYRTINTSLWQQIAIAAVFILVGLLMYFFFSRELANKNQRLNKLYRSKIDFLHDMSHEIKTPLTVVATGIDFADLQLSEDKINVPQTRDALEKIRNETQRIGRMVDSMVYLAALDEANENRMRVDFAALLANGAEMFKHALAKQDTELSLEIAPGLPDVYVEGDRFIQVIANILSNAAEHTKGGSISLKADYDHAYITVCVSDTGSGVCPEILPHVFERGVSGKGGTGYGLYICKAIVEAHGGTISITNEPGADVAGITDKQGAVAAGVVNEQDADGVDSTSKHQTGATVTFTVPVYGGQEAGHKL